MSPAITENMVCSIVNLKCVPHLSVLKWVCHLIMMYQYAAMQTLDYDITHYITVNHGKYLVQQQ